MSSFSQEHRLLRFISPLKGKVLLPERLSGVEGISQLFRYTVDLLAPAGTEIKPEDIVARPATIGISVDSAGTERFINGIVASFESCGGDEEFNNYRAIIVPSLWALTLNTNTRILQFADVMTVIDAVLKPYKINLSDETSNKGPQIEYCTQYRETDFQFISRLMEQHNIFYYFKHTENSHTLTFQDDSSKLTECATQSGFRYAPEHGKNEGFYDFVIDTFSSKSSLVTGKFTAWDHSFFRHSRVPSPLSSIFSGQPTGKNDNESYDYADSAAAYFIEESSDSNIENEITQFLFSRRNASDSGAVAVQASSNAMVLSAGFTFSLEEHPQESLNGTYLLTSMECELQQLPSFRARTAPSPRPYHNRFTAVPASQFFLPPLVTPKPRVHGMHTGIAVTPKGDDSRMDNFGRVWVHFWWDRKRISDAGDLEPTASLRVAQSWAGKGWGTYFWPRIGDEVLISFIEGDPDQPIIVGSLYNGQNLPKYDPAGQYTLSGILTRSSKDGGAANANELRFEDLKGKEQVYMNAERDYDLHVENTWHTLVGNEQHTTVGTNRVESIGKNSDLTIGKSEFKQVASGTDTTIGENQRLTVGSNVEETIGGSHKKVIGSDVEVVIGGHHIEQTGSDYVLQVANNCSAQVNKVFNVEAGANVYLKGGGNVVIQSDQQICLSGPGGFITIGPAGVIIQGTIVMINSGGVAIPIVPVFPAQMGEGPKDPETPNKPEFPGDEPPSKHINQTF